jgi:hypothetical protein
MLNRATLIRPSHVSRIAASPVISKTAAPMALALAGRARSRRGTCP